MRKKKKRSAFGKAVRGLTTALLAVFLVIFLTSFFVGGYFFVNVMRVVGGDPVIDLDEAKQSRAQTTVIYANDKNGQPVEYARLHGEQNRMWLDLENMGEPREATGMPLIADAYVALEDKRFWDHKGVDWTRFVAVITTYEFTQGASTITQQLIKNVTQEKDVTAVRKYREILTALNMERNYAKTTILEGYLNELYLGRGCYGVKTGAERYFGKEVSELNIAECAALASITKAPSFYDPIKNLDNNRERMEYCLKEMRDQGKITREEYEEALAYPIEFQAEPAAAQQSQPEQVNNYYVDFIIDTVISDLKRQYDMSESEAWRKVYYGGLKIFAAVDMDIQKSMEDVFSKRTTFSELKGSAKNPIHAAMAVMDYEGRVVGIVGGAGQKPGNRSLNRAAQSWRQPGSTIKPLAVYGPAIEKDLIHWSTLTENSAIAYNGDMWPHNVDGTLGNGAYVTVQTAIEKSINTVSARTVYYTLKARAAFDFLKEHFGFAKLDDKRDPILEPMSVGSMTYGFSALEECAAYAVFGNGGTYYSPYCYFRVTDNTGNTVILEKKQTVKRAFSEDTAKVMNELLRTVPLDNYYSGNNAKNIGKFLKFGKTGTTSKNMDRWFSGGTPYYVGSVWFGYDTPSDLGDNMTNPSARIWMEVFNRIHGGLDSSKKFPASSKAVAKSYCTQTGKLATDNCPNTATGWYRTSNIPGECTSSHIADNGLGGAINNWIDRFLGGGATPRGTVPGRTATTVPDVTEPEGEEP
ncbi:MAG: transglycosylase domain-containing protein [Firmicutes bacterium]|nr:transglycosylase domain-containing protein [Bacillota bacterium]